MPLSSVSSLPVYCPVTVGFWPDEVDGSRFSLETRRFERTYVLRPSWIQPHPAVPRYLALYDSLKMNDKVKICTLSGSIIIPMR